MPKVYHNTFVCRAPPGPAGGALSAPPDRPSRNRGGPISKGRDISIDWFQDGTTSLQYKAQRESRVPSSSHILLMENKHRKFFVM